MNNFRQVKVTVILALLVLMPLTACAESNSRDRKGPQGPPPEAIQACEGKQEGDAVSFKGRRGETLNATCSMVEEQLVAVPEGHSRRE